MLRPPNELYTIYLTVDTTTDKTVISKESLLLSVAVYIVNTAVLRLRVSVARLHRRDGNEYVFISSADVVVLHVCDVDVAERR